MTSYHLTNGVHLDRFVERDAMELTELVDRNRQYLREFMQWLDNHKSIGDSLGFIQRSNLYDTTREEMAFAIRESDRIIGVTGFHSINHDTHTAEIGYWIDQQCQGKGTVTMATTFLMNYGFETLNLVELRICCGVSNIRSNNVPKRLGFTRCRVIPNDVWMYDHHVDSNCYEMNVDEWRRLQAASTKEDGSTEALSQRNFKGNKPGLKAESALTSY